MVKKTALIILICLLGLFGCGKSASNTSDPSAPDFSDLVKTGSMELEFAEQFSVDYYKDGYSLITVGDGRKYLLIPQEKSVPKSVDGDVTVIFKQPESIYLAASSAMDLFRCIGSLEDIKLTSTNVSDWRLPDVTEALENGEMIYAGKYSAPDYELILTTGCTLAIESTMIYHSPDAMEQLENLGIPVMVERSSYEAHPLGRMEWIKLYGLLMGKEDIAEQIFNEKTSLLREFTDPDVTESEKKSVVFFYISSNGYVNVRKPGDYISRMIELAGGRYIFSAEDLNADENALSTMNLQMETFYEKSRDADILIYNSTVDGELETASQLLEKSSLIADFKAYQEGNVWCTEKDMFQETSGMADMIYEFHTIIAGDTEETKYLHRLG